jgi:hypothetical protein
MGGEVVCVCDSAEFRGSGLNSAEIISPVGTILGVATSCNVSVAVAVNTPERLSGRFGGSVGGGGTDIGPVVKRLAASR